jgi:hypothetical protein
MPGTVKSELLSYADRITKCEPQEKDRGQPQNDNSIHDLKTLLTEPKAVSCSKTRIIRLVSQKKSSYRSVIIQLLLVFAFQVFFLINIHLQPMDQPDRQDP